MSKTWCGCQLSNHVGTLRYSNGEALTARAAKGEGEADKLAKQAVQQHRVDPSDVNDWKQQAKEAKAIAMWIARATWAANICEDEPFRDSEANRTRHAELVSLID